MVKIQYIYNSGFVLETEDVFLAFDVYTLDLNLPKNKDCFYFISHGHEDHFSPRIFKNSGKAEYILSTHIKELYDLKEYEDKIYWISSGQELELNSFKVKTFSSTDEGVSFYIELEDCVIYHGGDHNWWAWEDQGEEKERQREKDYKKEVIPLLKEREIDIAFIPVDPRLEKNTFLGIDYFIETLHPKNVFPMHFREDYSIMKPLKEREVKNIKIHTIKKELENFNIES